MKILIRPFILAQLMLAGTALSAQEKAGETLYFGYYSSKPEYVLERADYAVHYRRTQLVVNNRTGSRESIMDTLTLAICQSRSVYYCTAYDTRFSLWGRQNVKKTRQATKPVSLQTVPLSSVLDKKNASRDYVEGNFGEPVLIYKDRPKNRVVSILYSPHNLLAEQSSSLAWRLEEKQDTILGFPCRCAEVHYAGRDYTVRYAPDIPIPDGPWKFCGLPGLILKAEDGEGLFLYEAIGLEMLDDAYITMDDDCEKVSVSYFNQVAGSARSIRKGSFLFEGELFFTEDRPYSYTEAELEEK